ncbi:DUF1616 domain-containing protein [Natrarchaeobius oligotrophus]|uniref:DUF1616 domain-containing protein n=1 Tax=Natrarchaeobius chitinivorans TaxID=1679083 RepID=A0A3N6MRH5_NATCH|nr:DUF1616 domain-containing protein [Natrarchaeobius chitinivorans]RQH00351.1 DUF1616 domain-containing protein [Natrarchaeobius chitinivorans]
MSFRAETRTRLEYVLLYPVDLAVVSLATVLAYLVVTSFPDGSVVRLALTVPLALFLPGYALTSVLFPATVRRGKEIASTDRDRRIGGIDAAERLGLSFVLSLAVVSLVVLVLSTTDWGLGTDQTAAGIGLLTVGFAQLGVVRRLRLPESERFSVSPVAAAGRYRREHGTLVTVSSAVLAVAVAAAVGALLVGFFAPASAGGFSELGLYTEDDDGDLVAGELPDEVVPGESVPITISVENHEGEPANYTAVVQQQVVDDGTVEERTHLQDVELESEDGETAAVERDVTPIASDGETVRISVLLYADDVPTSPTNENADEDVYFWVTVTDEPETEDA